MVVGYVGLDPLVVGPRLVAAEHADFHTHTGRPGLQLANEKGHVLPDLGLSAEVGGNVRPERSKVGHPAR